MKENLFLGCSLMTACLVIQCLVISVLLRSLYHLEQRGLINCKVAGATILLSFVMLAMLLGNLLQISFWAVLFLVCGEFADFSTAFYHSVVNFATLGYCDLVMSEGRRLLGALEAVNGVLMFGLSTGMLFLILSELMNKSWEERVQKERSGAAQSDDT
jgi:hypothetical protein